MCALAGVALRRYRGLCVRGAVLWGLVALPKLAAACAVCGFGREENRVAFIATTVVLSLLPVLSIGGVVLWLWRQARSRARAARPAVGDSRPI